MFQSEEPELVRFPSDTEGKTDIFVHDRNTGITERVNVAPCFSPCAGGGILSNGNAQEADITDDGRFVVFVSEDATSLDPTDTDGFTDIYLHDRVTVENLRVTKTLTPNFTTPLLPIPKGNGNKDQPVISGDGRFIAFRHLGKVVIYDVQVGNFKPISVLGSGQSLLDAREPSISLLQQGKVKVAFSAKAPGGAKRQVFVRTHNIINAGGSSTKLVSASGEQADEDSGHPAIDDDGIHVAFASQATNLAPGGSDPGCQGQIKAPDVFRFNLQTNDMALVSQPVAGLFDVNDVANEPAISPDGQVVTFTMTPSEPMIDLSLR